MIRYLHSIYPNSLLNPTKNEIKKIDDYYHIQETINHLYIPLVELEEREIQLLKLLVNDKKTQENNLNSLEKLIIHGEIDNSIKTKLARLIYLKIDYLEIENYKLWKKILTDSIEEIVELSVMDENLIILLLDVEKNEKQSINKLKEVVKSLDQDLNLLSQGMIGQNVNLNPQIKNIFSYEKEIFTSFIQSKTIDGIANLSDLLINQIATFLKKQKPELTKLSNLLLNKNELRKLIEYLFKNQGNLSQTAEDLFIHRNTLSYRMNKFYDETGFNLNYFPDLIICYLLVE